MRSLHGSIEVRQITERLVHYYLKRSGVDVHSVPERQTENHHWKILMVARGATLLAEPRLGSGLEKFDGLYGSGPDLSVGYLSCAGRCHCDECYN
jgi:hypothetical protein